jgi:hypothetical protein
MNDCQSDIFVYLTVNFQNFPETSAGATLLSQWFQPTGDVTENAVIDRLDEIAERVKQSLPEKLASKYSEGQFHWNCKCICHSGYHMKEYAVFIYIQFV